MIALVVLGVSSVVGTFAGECIYHVILKRRAIKLYGPGIAGMWKRK